MGTSWSARIVDAPAGIAPVIEAALASVIAAMSQWEPESALSRFNRAPAGAWQVLPAPLLSVLDAALALWRRSGGAFDPAAGVAADLWGFGAAGRVSTPPADAAIAAALARSGAGAIERDGDSARRTADVALDLSGIAKGYAVDLLADAIAAAGARDFLVEIGGEYVGRGIKPDGQPWWVALETPPGLVLEPLMVALHGQALATSGDYRRFVSGTDGRRLGHTLDPRTARPIENGVVSTSVLADTCMAADGWATTLGVLGPVRGIALADSERLAARIVTADGAEYLSQRMAALIDG
ncbi:FAD:protein FMN transferase [Sphingomonas baiyangensis]|uniref:FAD:protein FMN transferase n=2 Tax=Sphingomonas baiyangensis TaxID=2572576 RepID=A0A4U1L7W5_9SPHN|nr:FAD:protein FMN transferase [Sphingomonas baiyangensis]